VHTRPCTCGFLFRLPSELGCSLYSCCAFGSDNRLSLKLYAGECLKRTGQEAHSAPERTQVGCNYPRFYLVVALIPWDTLTEAFVNFLDWLFSVRTGMFVGVVRESCRPIVLCRSRQSSYPLRVGVVIYTPLWKHSSKLGLVTLPALLASWTPTAVEQFVIASALRVVHRSMRLESPQPKLSQLVILWYLFQVSWVWPL
jgi:hypothetical protein